MTLCDEISSDEKKELKRLTRLSDKTGFEYAFSLCDGYITKIAEGVEDWIDIPDCPDGENPKVVFHTHPIKDRRGADAEAQRYFSGIDYEGVVEAGLESQIGDCIGFSRGKQYFMKCVRAGDISAQELANWKKIQRATVKSSPTLKIYRRNILSPLKQADKIFQVCEVKI